ncbi:unnamed protein product [Ilex paraguariensis]|uniref:Pectinesterase inhibitor n=1 Tax=Ilex paraguariensis TaxID=185542 RepID=A0ABC8QUM6_9AQUA
MASTYDTFSLLVFLFLACVFLNTSPSHAYNPFRGVNVDMKRVCDGTINPRNCWERLRPGYGTPGSLGDAYSLADNYIAMARRSANDIHDLLGNLVESTNDHPQRQLYRDCAGRYNQAIRDLDHATKHLQSGDYRRVAADASQAPNEVRDCNAQVSGYSFGGPGPFRRSYDPRFPGYTPLDSSGLPEMIQDFELYCNIVNNVATYLPRN